MKNDNIGPIQNKQRRGDPAKHEKDPEKSAVNLIQNIDVWELAVSVLTSPYWYPKMLIEKSSVYEPLPNNFDYTYATRAYYNRFLTLLCYTLGMRFAPSIPSVINTVFSPADLFLTVYIIMPILALLAHHKTTLTQLSLNDRRVLLCLHAFVSGLIVAHLLRHYISDPATPPVYFIPGIIALTIYGIGPKFSYNRSVFLTVCVGTASFVSLVICFTMVGPIRGATIVAILLQTVCALINVQCMIFDVLKGNTDLIHTNIVGLLLTMITYFVTKVWTCRYDANANDINLPSFVSIVAS